MQALFNRIEIEKDKNRHYIRNIQNAGQTIYFFGLKGNEMVYMAVCSMVFMYAKPGLFYEVLVLTFLVWWMLFYIRHRTKPYRLYVWVYTYICPKKHIAYFPKKEIAKPILFAGEK